MDLIETAVYRTVRTGGVRGRELITPSYSIEEETKERWEHAQNQTAHFAEKEQVQAEKVEKINQAVERNRQEQADLAAEIRQWDVQSKEHYKLLDRYTSTHALHLRVEEQQMLVQSLQKERDERADELQMNEEELAKLERNQIESPRQQAAIEQLRKQGIRAYAFRHFVELQDRVTIEKERLFDTIKYTVFYDASSCKPTNDLYHVSLRGIIPARSLTSLPKWGLHMREGLTTNEQNQAARVLWWVEQFFSEQFPMITSDALIDAQGMRGAQEQSTYILSKKAVETQKANLRQQIAKLVQEKKSIEEKLSTENGKLQVWNADIRKVEEAEAFLTTKAEQDYRINLLTERKKDFQRSQKDKTAHEQATKKYWEEGYHWTEVGKKRAEDLVVYQRFGEQAEKINHLQALQQTAKKMRQEIGTMKNKVHRMTDRLEEYGFSIRKNTSHIEAIEDAISQSVRKFDQITHQKNEKEAERVASAKEAEAYRVELVDLTQLIPHIVEEAMEASAIKTSKYELQNRQNQARVEFEHACTEKDIDPHAVENYHTLEAEVTRKKEELISAKNLLEENEERAEQNEQRLENSIAMQVQKINLLFEQYMGMFQFEGRVIYEKDFDKKGRPIFKLFIRVRKEGHGGKLEDVSVKARGGRVGKGVSGGEESLSSLLFALSLLQNLENRASFIVMDEFDSALDDTRKEKVFELYAKELQRKLIILSPKGHEDEYYDQFSKAFIVSHNPEDVQSKVRGLTIKKGAEATH